MIIAMAKHMLFRSFSKIKFRFTDLDWHESKVKNSSFGLYLHVPFCKIFCSFCPFYKVIYNEKLKEKYIHGVKREIVLRRLEGKARWVYIGGGTPNLLKAEEIHELLSYLKQFVEVEEIGMEGNPFEFKSEYLVKICEAGINKISMGIETFNLDTLKAVKRAKANEILVEKITNEAQKLGISVNVDLMVGLPNQNIGSCLKDAEIIASIAPDQVTIYPYLVIPGVMASPSMDSKSMFEIIEGAWSILKENEYNRDSIWVFSKGQRIYDSAKDELVCDYFGLGPAAFSTCENLQTVNPPIELYLKMLEKRKRIAFCAELDNKAKVWRSFAHELYKLQLDQAVYSKMPSSIKMITRILRMAGYIQGLKVTDKGRYFVHEITKTVVETLPFPLSNPDTIENREEYEKALREVNNA
jgi:oxygen-independent coproporphyrinogen-3 oxidase